MVTSQDKPLSGMNVSLKIGMGRVYTTRLFLLKSFKSWEYNQEMVFFPFITISKLNIVEFRLLIM